MHGAPWPHARPLCRGGCANKGNSAAEQPTPFLPCSLKQAGAASVKMVSFLSKPARRTTPYEPDYLCFDVPDKFVVGMGLDFNEQYRSLPYVGVLKPECYS